VDWALVKESRSASSASRYGALYLSVTEPPEPVPTYKPTYHTPPKPVAPVAPKPTLASTITVDGKKVKVTGTWQVSPAVGTVPEQTVTVYTRGTT
jgi:hypothetical protein